jgi:hypothetical protein
LVKYHFAQKQSNVHVHSQIWPSNFLQLVTSANETIPSIETTRNTNNTIMSADALFGQGIFEDLQRKIDEDTAVKDVCGDQRLQNPMA